MFWFFERSALRWQRRTFPHATPYSILCHLEEEIREIREAVGEDDDVALRKEIGDAALLLITLARWSTGESLLTLARRTFAPARRRRYVYDPALGYAKHVEESTS
ncbi:MAG: hypothetical protein K0S99_148 [Thermomicrobiales bacterium]|jgi:NTP pyrophosphatase (non-canonical NTP hydrolase)|nr:hypothetical protein [Thermomicrobiales bacterium]